MKVPYDVKFCIQEELCGIWHYLHLSVKVSHLSCLSNPAVGVQVGLFNINFADLFCKIFI